jgi:hypothetical protein
VRDRSEAGRRRISHPEVARLSHFAPDDEQPEALAGATALIDDHALARGMRRRRYPVMLVEIIHDLNPAVTLRYKTTMTTTLVLEFSILRWCWLPARLRR